MAQTLEGIVHIKICYPKSLLRSAKQIDARFVASSIVIPRSYMWWINTLLIKGP